MYNKSKKIHFIGICGISMSALAKYSAKSGKIVSGSDKNCFKTDAQSLKSCGITIFKRHKKKNVLGADLVVYTSAVSDKNAELKYALKKGIPVVKRSEFLNLVLKHGKRGGYRHVVAVSGSHGKTTVTALISNVFEKAQKDPCAFIGGMDKNLSNFRYGKGDFAVVEACEYKKNLLDISSEVAVVLNIDNDHLDSYKNMDEMAKVFDRFTSNKTAVVNADDNYAKNLSSKQKITFGIINNADFKAKYIKRKENGYDFSVFKGKEKLCRVFSSLKGKHNIYNALAVFAVADFYGIDASTVKAALENFGGVGRRMELLGEKNGVNFYADYAHHPREISALIKSLNDSPSERLIVFQPHTFSRTEKLFGDFTECFKEEENLIIYKTFAAREKYSKKGSSKRLFSALKRQSDGKKPYYAKNRRQIKKIIFGKYFKKRGENIKTVLFVGAGDLYYVAKNLLNF